jgi:hypothetical protein
MKAKMILVNWALSFIGLCVDTELTPLWIVMALVAWFIASSGLVLYGDRRGWLDKFFKDNIQEED